MRLGWLVLVGIFLESPLPAASAQVGEAALAEAARGAAAITRRAEGLRRQPPAAPKERPPGPRARLCYSPEDILRAVAGYMGISLCPESPLPALRYESDITLAEFQGLMAKQWGMRPPVITNAFAEDANVIVLMDDPGYYSRLGRWVDDSLAHEYVHYLQSRYRGQRMTAEDDSLEPEAVYAQSWFRDAYLRGPSRRPGCGLPQ